MSSITGGMLRSLNLIFQAKGSQRRFKACNKKWSDLSFRKGNQMAVAGWVKGKNLEKVIITVQERNDKGWNKGSSSPFGNLIMIMIL